MAKNILPTPKSSVIDVGTGSGILAIASALNGAGKVMAVDVADEALRMAKINTKLNNVHERIDFLKSRYFDNIPDQKFDIILSNPPCMPFHGKLDFENKGFRLAVDGGEDGTIEMIKFLKEAKGFLKTSGLLLFPLPKWSDWKKIRRVMYNLYSCKIIDKEVVRYYLTDIGPEFKRLINKLVVSGKATISYDQHGDYFFEVLLYECRPKNN